MEPSRGGLATRLELSPGLALGFRPVDLDTFRAGGMTLRFQRDPAGKIVAFDYSNPLVRSIRFTRLSDRTGLAGPLLPALAVGR